MTKRRARSEPTVEEAQAQRVYDLLVRSAGASEYWREDFVRCQTEGCTEYRFMGFLGFGGKFWNNAGRWYVSYYSEDRTTAREAIVAEVNAALTRMHEEDPR